MKEIILNRLSSAVNTKSIGDTFSLLQAEEHRYLMDFGYLPQSDLETGNLRTDDQLRDAIRTLQTFGSIPATGEMDDATVSLMQKPRCGLPDIASTHFRSKRYTLHGQKWHYTNLTWSLRTMNPRGLDPGVVRAELYRALDVWAQNSKLSFREVNDDRADILVFFEKGYHGDGYPFDGPGQILAHAFFPGGGRGGDAHFDEDETWLLLEGDHHQGTSLFAVAAHEFGHSLGLSHSSVAGALMFPWYQGLKPNFQLPDDDRHGIQQLYGPKDDRRVWEIIPNYSPHPPINYPTHPPYPRPPPELPTQPPRQPPQTPREPPRQPPLTPRLPPTRSDPVPPEKPTKKPHGKAGKPDTCDTSYDAISVIRREVFIFKGRYIWRIGDSGLYAGYPAETHRMWNDLPKNYTHIDAVYERGDKKIVFFIGKQYYLYNGNELGEGFPKPLTNLGLPESLEKIDGAMVWGHNGKTYFFSGTMYWKFDEDIGKVELDYPRDMSMWSGVGYNIDTVFQWKDGRTYFFKGKGFWKFNDGRMRVENEQQTLSAPVWMGCPREMERPTEPSHLLPPKELDIQPLPSQSNTISVCVNTLLTVLLLHYVITPSYHF
ncbi:matrix metalloproteinase-2-like isoform X2 [Zootermopsis nevadensis]|uniref:matrix metalloproteinase-2-like isoform X2 n=1 Tax=Zootermopsis nevadensis TaxID=136037 RepID=UPI000B8EC747|nr:matrix metalloproteinase-2-like isoform X2 [Zootermopsis nevadensis]